MVRVRQDLTGHRFGQLTVVKQAEDYVSPKGKREACWECVCACGKISTILQSDLKSGRSTSCGCNRRKTVCGIGICDIPIHNCRKVYDEWSAMIKRCYDPKSWSNRPNYQHCFVCSEWLLFSNFKKWFDVNSQWCSWNANIALDKDWLYKGNTEYSPAKCVVVPEQLNTLLLKREADRGQLPIGVYFHKATQKYVAQVCLGAGKSVYLGVYSTPTQAFRAYKRAKEAHIKQMADTYKKKYKDFPPELYKAMYEYQVEIAD